MYSSSRFKNLSINEHRAILKKRYSKKHLSTNGLIINECGNFSYIEVLSDIEISGVKISGNILKKMFQEFLTYGEGEIISFHDGYLLNENTGEKFIFECSFNGLYFDTSILFFNYLNEKTINHFSSLIIRKNEVLYYMKRSNWRVLFALKLK